MASINLASNGLFVVCTGLDVSGSSPGFAINNGSTIDAAGESSGTIGTIQWADGGTHKVSSSGGAIRFRPGSSLTWATANSQLKFGIGTSFTAGGLEDGTYDVFGLSTQGGGGANDTLTASTTKSIAMSSGSKSLANGTKIWVGVEFITRNGADSIQISASSVWGGNLFPYATLDQGTLAKSSNNPPLFTIVADDGTIGWIHRLGPVLDNVASMGNYQSGDAINEMAAVLSLPFSGRMVGWGAYLSSIAATDDYALKLYTNPTGTPSAQRTISVDADLVNSVAGTGWHEVMFEQYGLSKYDYVANTPIALSVLATSANNIQFFGAQFNSSFEGDRAGLQLGTAVQKGHRGGSSGAFTQTAHLVPLVQIFFDQIDSGGSSGPIAGNMRGGFIN